MQRKIIVLILGIIMIFGILTTTSLSTTRANNNTLTEEKVQAMVDEKVQSAVQGAVTEMKAGIEAENQQKEGENQVQNKPKELYCRQRFVSR